MKYRHLMAKISIIVPVYFNEQNLPTTLPTLQNILDKLGDLEGEIICVDDGSGDRSFEILKEFASRDSRIKIIRLAKNFGAWTALLAGLDAATGDCRTFIMADLQDPPELILEMAAAWKAGHKIVLAERTDREDPWMDRTFARTFWRFMHRFASRTIPKGGFDCVLFDKQVSDILTTAREKNSHIMIQVLWTGFEPKIIPYVRRQRKEGKSRWTFSKKFKLFIDSSIAFSYLPIRLMSLAGLFTAVSGFLFAGFVLYDRLRSNVPVPGWTSLTVIVLIIGGVQMLLLGVIGEYLWRTFDQTRHRPDYVVKDRINL